MKKCIPLIALALVLAMSAGVFAMEVPTDTIVQNRGGSQQAVKTYTISPVEDPQGLIEEPFVLEGYRYSFADIVKTENRIEDVKPHTETVTVETSKKDLETLLEALAPTMAYDDGLYSGTLALDHTSIRTEAAGYATKSYVVTATKTIGQLDRNDMSYVPSTTVKDGVTLKLSNVDWQVTGTDLVGETLAPSSYQAVASYSGTAYYSAATGYITTAEYAGEIARNDVESVTYTLTYLGEEIAPAVPEEEEIPLEEDPPAAKDPTADGAEEAPEEAGAPSKIWPYAVGGAGVAAAVIFAILLLRARGQVRSLRANLETEDDYEEEPEE